LSGRTLAPVDAEPQRKPAADRPFLSYLEGVRGFFCLYVACVHAWLRTTAIRPELLPFTPFVDHFQSLSQPVVAVFIVLSGFVLGLPVARRGQTFAGGIANFAKKRALRILPAYYAVLLVAIPISYFTAAHFQASSTPAQFLVAVGLHLAMLHDISNRYIQTLDLPMWSIAVEVDIYILFPLLLVPVARRFGFVWMIVASFALGLIPTMNGAVHHNFGSYALSLACFWYIGLFGLGYAAANLTVDKRPAFRRLLEHLPWRWFALPLLALALLSVWTDKPWSLSHRWITDIFVGSAFAAQLAADAQARLKGRRTCFERFFTLKPSLFLGTFSYSLYLLHFPVIDLFLNFERSSWTDPQVIATACAAVVAALAFSYVFYRTVERPFMTDYRRRGDEETLRSAGTPIVPIPAFVQRVVPD
jgi:peptidoglycan/LPS O-acetylase OafA/YrhL